MVTERQVNPKFCTDKLRVDHPHVGLYDVDNRQLWMAKKRIGGGSPIRVSHARLLLAGDGDGSTADKDRFMCYWFHPPNTGEGYVQGYPIEWNEGHLMVRLDPYWDYKVRKLIPSTDTARIDHNLDQQYGWGGKIFETYLALKPPYPLSWHMIGPRVTDSMFYVRRFEASKPW